MKKYSMYEAGKPACNTERSFPYQVTDGKTYRYDRAVALYSVLHDLIDGKIKEDDVEGRLEEAFEKVPTKSNLQKLIEIHDMQKLIMRYVSSETKHLTTAVSKDVEVSPDMTVTISPDYWYIDKTPIMVDGEALADMTVELIKLKVGKKEKSDKELYEDIGLYAMLKEARTKVPTGKKAFVKASYYYLRRSDDSNGQRPHFSLNFFESGGGNTFTISEDYVGGSMSPMATDVRMAPIIEAFLKGKEEDECTKKDCEKCILNAICHYSEPPIQIKKEKAATKLSAISLTKAQEEAVNYRKGIVRINAGAGAGKTTVVALRVASMLAEGEDPSKIFLTTFTNSGAEEMRERIGKYIEDFGLEDIDTSAMTICTFNAYGNEVIKKEYKRMGFSSEPSVIDEIERSKIISDMLNKTDVPGLDYRHFQMDSLYVKGALPMAKRVFDIIKKNQYGIGDIDHIISDLGYSARFVTREGLEKLVEMFDEYDCMMRDENLIEFADQEVLLMQLLAEDPYYLDQFGYEHIIVDEFQDSNENQIKFLQMLSELPTFKSLMVVGDDNQAIFAFRGTTPEYIINFHKYFAGRKVDDINLLENQRSKELIIDFANEIAGLNRTRVIKTLIPTRKGGSPVKVMGFIDKEDEQNYIVEGIQNKIDAGAAPEEIAYIAATKDELIKMADLLNEKGIPSVMMNPEPMLKNSRVVAAIAFFKFMADENDTKSAVIYLNASIGGGIKHLAEDEIDDMIGDLQEKIQKIQKADSEEQMKALEEVLRSIDHNDDEIYQAFLEKLLVKPYYKLIDYIKDYEEFGEREARRRDHSYPGVVLTTAHSSKGLEWPIVFNSISNYDSEELHKRGNNDKVEEKRRLLFVSCTRARDELFVTGLYTAFGSAKAGYTYNQFLKECYDIMKMPFDGTSIEAQRAAKKAEKQAKKKAEKEEMQKKAS